MIKSKTTARVATNKAEISALVRRAREREKSATKIVRVRFDATNDTVAVELSTGSSVIVPRTSIPGFVRASAGELSDLRIDSGAESLWSDILDDGVLREQLIEIAAGSELVKILGGRISGRQTSVAKAAAARKNGAKGGRPRGVA